MISRIEAALRRGTPVRFGDVWRAGLGSLLGIAVTGVLARLFMGGDIHVFTIRFQPGGFYALFGIPMTELADQGVLADDVIGAAAAGLRDAVMLADNFDARTAAARHGSLCIAFTIKIIAAQA